MSGKGPSALLLYVYHHCALHWFMGEVAPSKLSDLLKSTHGELAMLHIKEGLQAKKAFSFRQLVTKLCFIGYSQSMTGALAQQR
eukprot:scaffold209178_cov30-Tisochrysis_lutea.AAC.1